MDRVCTTSGFRKHRTRIHAGKYDSLAENHFRGVDHDDWFLRPPPCLLVSKPKREAAGSAGDPGRGHPVADDSFAVQPIGRPIPCSRQLQTGSERTTDVGCWIMAHQPVGQLTTEPFWHLDVYPTRAAAETAMGPRGTVVESLGKVWLLTIEKAGWRPAKGEHVAKIGPLPIVPGEEYTAQYMEAIFNPGMTSSIHTHAGPEAWYTVVVWRRRKVSSLDARAAKR
jgi:hypothetical protein